MKKVITRSFEETQKLGFDFAKILKGGEVVCLHGDLGSGKTTFVQGLAKGLGIEKRIISPTFIIVRTYEVKSHTFAKLSASKSKVTHSQSSVQASQKSKVFYHIDLYRIEEEKDVEGLGLLEIMQDPESIVVIEWPEKIENLLPSKRIDLFFKYIDENRRKIIFE